jgi:AcrR family transcriptional regulator
MIKGEETKEKILSSALYWARRFGLESLTIGELAKTVGMSKSGLFGHFKSKETLQLKVLDFAAQHFTNSVIIPAIKAPRGIPRIKEMVGHWLQWASESLNGGCPFVAAVTEFDDRPGPIREKVRSYQEQIIDTFSKACSIAIVEGHFSKNTEPRQFAFELYGLMLGHHLFFRLLEDPDVQERFNISFGQLLEKYQGQAGTLKMFGEKGPLP